MNDLLIVGPDRFVDDFKLLQPIINPCRLFVFIRQLSDLPI